MRKVFDCTDMPRNVNRIFMDNTDAGNDVFVEYYVCDKDGDINGEGEQDRSEERRVGKEC